MAPREEIAKVLGEYRGATGDQERLSTLLFLERLVQPSDREALELLIEVNTSSGTALLRDMAGKILERLKKRFQKNRQACAAASAPGGTVPAPPASAASPPPSPPSPSAVASGGAPVAVPAPPGMPPPPVHANPALEKFLQFLGHPQSDFRMKAVQAALQVNLFEAVPYLSAKAAEETDPQVLVALLRAIGTLGDEAVLPQLVGFLDNPDPAIRAAALEGLDGLKTEAKYQHFVKLMGDEANEVRAAAVKALGTYGRPNLMRLLTTMAESGDPAGKMATFNLLDNMSGGEVNDLLYRLADDPSPNVRTHALLMMGKKGDERIMAKAERLLSEGAESDLEALMLGLDSFRADNNVLSQKRGRAKAIMAKIRARLSGKSADDLLMMPDELANTAVRGPEEAAVLKAKLKALRDKRREVDAYLNEPEEEEASAPRRHKGGGARRGDDNSDRILSRFNFLTRITFVLRWAALGSVLVGGLIYMRGYIAGSVSEAKNARVALELDRLAGVMRAFEVGGSHYSDTTLNGLVGKGLMEVPKDPWSEEYKIDPFWRKLYSSGADRTSRTTWVLETLRSGELNGNDDTAKFYSPEKPGRLWITIAQDDFRQTFQMVADGTNPSVVTTGDLAALPESPALGRGGAQTAFVGRDREQQLNLYVGRALFLDAEPVPIARGRVGHLSWSASGKYVAYELEEDASGNVGPWSYVLDVASKSEMPIRKDDVSAHPCFHPVDELVAYVDGAGQMPGSIRIFDPMTQGSRPFPGDLKGAFLQWGTEYLYFLEGYENGSYQSIVRARTKNGQKELILKNSTLVGPIALSPDRSKLAYVAAVDDGWSVEVVALERRQTRRILLSLFPVEGLSWIPGAR